METLKEVKNDLETVSTIKDIAVVYQEISNLKMREIREMVLNNRSVFRALSHTYQRVKSSYILHNKKLGNKKKTFRSKKIKKTVAVFLSANRPFYGDLITNIWNGLMVFLRDNSADLVVAGRTGKYLAEKQGFGFNLFYFELDDVDPKREEVKNIAEFIKRYEKIIVFHGRYKTSLSQELAKDDISGGVPFKKVKDVGGYLFEPSIEAILGFFEDEIISVLFNQSVMEHQLAKYASRMMVMYQSVENAKKVENKLKREKNRLKKEKLNKEQVKIFSNLNLLSL